MNSTSPTRIQPVILSGGAGRRLWPLSRAMYPKQFQRFSGDTTLFQATAQRVAEGGMNAPLVVCNQEHRFIVAEQLAQVGIKPADIILEPVSRNTAPAIVSAALWAERHAPDCHLLVLPSDHIIHDDEGFTRKIASVVDAAESDSIVVLGVQAEWANPDFGYILPGGSAPLDSPVRRVAAFHEKPGSDELDGMLKDQSWLWNTGMILAKPETIIKASGALAATMVDLLKRAQDRAVKDLDFLRLDTENFEKIDSISFDKLILEQTDTLMVAPLETTWTDASNWQAVWQSGLQDNRGNVVRGDVILEQTSGCLVFSDETLTTTLGIDNLAIVVTDDSVLVADLDHAKDLNLVVDRVADAGQGKDLFHSRVYRPWGSYKGLAMGDRFQVKEIVVNPGASLSLQKHFHRAEHWIVVEGTAKVRRGDEEFLLNENQSTYIPLGEVHRLENPGKIPIRLVEVQSGSYLGEDDIVRFEDTYGRN